MSGTVPRRESCRQKFEIPFSAMWYLDTLWQCKVYLMISKQSTILMAAVHGRLA